jgi:A/G-specific adenine glycosylase
MAELPGTIESSGGRPTLAIRRALLRWYRQEGRHDLPWRSSSDPWHVLLAELMLQRTRADLVGPVYQRVLGEWPAAGDLADAPPDFVTDVMRPLGLTHRVPRIQAAAAAVRNGVPKTMRGLLYVPGVGPYVATATLCFAYGRRLAVVDPSVIRILTRLVGLTSDRSRPRTDRRIWEEAQRLLPPRNAREWNFAVLDLGARICRPRPRCPECPVLRYCPTGRANIEVPE